MPKFYDGYRDIQVHIAEFHLNPKSIFLRTMLQYQILSSKLPPLTDDI